ncbi:MAG: hypothetical protein ACREMA_17445 [Longimicrobiales bacterium]
MTDQIALIIVAAGGVIFSAIGAYAVLMQAEWMNRYFEQNKDIK